MLSGDVPCSQEQLTHSCTAMGWRSMELVSKLFDTPSYKMEKVQKENLSVSCRYGAKVSGRDETLTG
jgi:hypothetical protein